MTRLTLMPFSPPSVLYHQHQNHYPATSSRHNLLRHTRRPSEEPHNETNAHHGSPYPDDLYTTRHSHLVAALLAVRVLENTRSYAIIQHRLSHFSQPRESMHHNCDTTHHAERDTTSITPLLAIARVLPAHSFKAVLSHVSFSTCQRSNFVITSLL